MTVKNLLTCAFAAAMSFMTTNVSAADDWAVVLTPYEDEGGTLIDWETENEFGGFRGTEVGDKVRITYDVIDTAPQMLLAVKIGEGWTWTEFISAKGYVDVPADGVYEFEIKDYPGSKHPVTGAVLAEAFTELGRPLVIKGQSVTVTKIEVLRKASLIKTYETIKTTNVENGDLNAWKNIIEIPASAFADLQVGDVIDINLDSQSGAQLQYAVKVGPNEEWTQLADYADVDNCYSINVEGTITNKQTPTISISAEDFVVAAKANGLFLKGQKSTVKSVVVKRLKTNAIENINADNNIDENKPMEIYSLDGRKMQNTNAHGIYIIRQGNKTIKVMK